MKRLWPALLILCLIGAGLWALRSRSHTPSLKDTQGAQSSTAIPRPQAPSAPASATINRQDSSATESRRSNPAAKVEPDPQVLLEKIRRSSDVITQSRDDHEKATAWLAVQDATNELPSALGNAPGDKCYDPHSSHVLLGCPGRDIIEEALSLGADIRYCGPGESWLEGRRGYEQYLKLWPDGPNADRAFWQSAVEAPCCDECMPTDLEQIRKSNFEPEDIKHLMKLYSAFLEKFPNSSLKSDAERKLQEYENLLKKEESAKTELTR
jgi:hypothetical protein